MVDFTNLSGSASYTNNGIITVRPSTAADAGLFNAAETDLDGDIHLQGNGELHLADKDTSDDQAVQINANNDSTLLSTTLTNGVDHTIRGTGGIQTNLTNQGLIHADNAGGTLTLINSQGTSPGDERFTLVNSGTIRADTGTTIDVLANGDTGDPFNQVAGAALQHTGTLLADGGDIAIESSVTGTGQGDLIARNGGSIQINGFAEVNNVAFDADASVNVDHELTVAGDLLAGVSGSVTYGNPSTAIINFTGGQGAAIGDWDAWARLELIGGSGAVTGFADLVATIQANNNATHSLSIPKLHLADGARLTLVNLDQSVELLVEDLVLGDNAILNLNGVTLQDQFTTFGAGSQIIDQNIIPAPPALVAGVTLLALSQTRRRRRRHTAS